jgi:hypothetical protein
MRLISKTLLSTFCLGLVSSVASAQTFVPTISLKGGESAELSNVSWTVNCKSMLKDTPEVEIVDGPPGVTASIRPGMVLPRVANCAKPVEGGTVVLTAGKEIDDPSNTRITLRVKYKTKDGNRQSSMVYNLALFP